MKQRRGAYAPEFRQQMVELVKAGRKPSELAKEFGCHDTGISAWVRQANADELGGGRPDAHDLRADVGWVLVLGGCGRCAQPQSGGVGVWRTHDQ